ncbi:elongation factor P--(R)-beta-lysine ligase [Candidatus Steffania adelgidicola]|uniref:elongation factor P--(R)-beta-lysine ligase n=1 Tax=Candidatus Steffania adelgidicola TaxID=1076626 RepID=UPI001D0252E1|nr:elongation factor P--(R)-beta-lysine ligase [Candidatus Steffania adelgidicola]UDG80056.1 Elongation factor P--(R)-beta-lysine ligase [Candidatus Steffania adelgidicola]
MSDLADWQPSAPISVLLKRAKIVHHIRQFFIDRGLLEVETPTLGQTTVTDVHLFPFQTGFIKPGERSATPLYLMTSPEYHMKRLLAAGSGPIFQLCHSFRNGEIGRYHNPEFTMLEWYRPHYDMYRLMNEVEDLLLPVLNCDSVETLSYKQAFTHYLRIDPLSSDKSELYDAVIKWNLTEAASIDDDRDTLLQLLFSMVVEPNIGWNKLVFIYHFPASQAALAAISTEDHRVADRFEVYFKGIELANGFRELTDAGEQRARFQKDNIKRAAMNLKQQSIDENLLSALLQGIPECSGVALGVDRLVMLALKADRLSEVMSFPMERA